MDPSGNEAEMDQLIELTKALSWSMKPPPSWRDAVSVESVAGRVLVGCVVSDRKLSLSRVIEVLKKAWPFDPKLEVTELASNIFLCEFSEPDAREKVFARQPWSVKGYLLVLQPWPHGLSWSEVDLDCFPVWVQIHGLPLKAPMPSLLGPFVLPLVQLWRLR